MHTIIITVHGIEKARYTVKNIHIAIAQIDYVQHTQDGNVHTFEMRKHTEDCTIPNSLSTGFNGTYCK